MELRVLRYFLAVVREETISGAAETLHVTQPTLSRQFKELEEELGKKLFIRGKRKVSLTEDGLLLRRRAQEIVELADQTEAAFHSSNEFVSGDVHIGGGETDGMRLIARAAKRMERKYPEVRYHLFSGNADDVTDRLDKGLLDFGVLIEPVDKKKYDYIKLPAFDTWGVLMRRDSPYASRESLSPEDLPGLPLICSRQSLVQNELSGWLGKEFEQLNIVATYNLLYNASLMVDEGLGCALCLDRIVNTAGSSLCFKPLVPRFEVGLIMVWKKYQVFSKAAGKFMEVLQAEVL